MQSNENVEQIIRMLPEIRSIHNRSSNTYGFIEGIAEKIIKSEFQSGEIVSREFGPFGNITFPYVEMGAISSLDLFGLDELIIFSFYQANKKRYKNTLDIGANIGLHSIVMSRCGFNVICFEPDPKHIQILERNLKTNDCQNVEVIQGAISDHDGESEFIRVEGNTTGSHLAGAKAEPYGDLSKFKVKIFNISRFTSNADFMKLDVEGHEVVVLKAIPTEHWQHLDAIVEVGTEKNAEEIWSLFKNSNINLFSQKNGWELVADLEDIPVSYKEGSLFVSSKTEMPW